VFEAIANVEVETSPEVAVYVGGHQVLRYCMKCSVCSVRDMYRWVNIRSTCDDDSGESDSLSSPTGYPDAECDGRHFVFVHGYSVSASSAREWADQVFKRLWLSGSHSMFTAVDWAGDYSRIGNVTPNYWANVLNALESAPALASRVNGLPGTKVMLAHSLGNMVTSEACKYHNLAYAKYYMLNAAVPVEAYDSDALDQDNMVPAVWQHYSDEIRSANWHAVFGASDGRSGLTWRGYFSGITNVVNCYSTTEDVLSNAPESGAGGAWSIQELSKGSIVMMLMPHVACEAGWGFNPRHLIPLSQGELLKTTYTVDELAVSPPFLPFADDWLHTTNRLAAAQVSTVLPRILADGIPATTFAAGANVINGVSENVNYSDYMPASDAWPSGRKVVNEDGIQRKVWLHSDIRDVVYYYVYKLYSSFVNGD